MAIFRVFGYYDISRSDISSAIQRPHLRSRKEIKVYILTLYDILVNRGFLFIYDLRW